MKFTSILVCFASAALLVMSEGGSPQRNKRSDDPSPLEATVMQQAEVITQLQAELASVKTDVASLKAKHENAVAFNVRLVTTHSQEFTGTEILILGQVDLNVGNGYDKNTGIFTAPRSGLYMFTLHISHTPPGSLHVNIFRNGSYVAEAEASGDDKYLDRSSTAVVLRLRTGDTVYVRRNSGSTSTQVQGDLRTSFAGILVVPE